MVDLKNEAYLWKKRVQILTWIGNVWRRFWKIHKTNQWCFPPTLFNSLLWPTKAFSEKFSFNKWCSSFFTLKKESCYMDAIKDAYFFWIKRHFENDEVNGKPHFLWVILVWPDPLLLCKPQSSKIGEFFTEFSTRWPLPFCCTCSGSDFSEGHHNYEHLYNLIRTHQLWAPVINL